MKPHGLCLLSVFILLASLFPLTFTLVIERPQLGDFQMSRSVFVIKTSNLLFAFPILGKTINQEQVNGVTSTVAQELMVKGRRSRSL